MTHEHAPAAVNHDQFDFLGTLIYPINIDL